MRQGDEAPAPERFGRLRGIHGDSLRARQEILPQAEGAVARPTAAASRTPATLKYSTA